MHDRSGVFGVIERPRCDELGKGTFHVESARLRVPKRGEQWAVGGALAHLL
jgi:hypothetical protein